MAPSSIEKPLSSSPDIRDEDSLKKAYVEHVEPTYTEFVDIDPALDGAITRSFDKHIVPWLFGLWLLAFIDRSNIGNAKIDGLVTDLYLGGNKFNIVGCFATCEPGLDEY